MEETGFGARVKSAREKCGFSLSQLASAAGVSRSYLHELESEETKAPGIYIALRLAAVLNVSVEFLAYGGASALKSESLEVVELRRRLLLIEQITKGEVPL